MSLQPWEEEHVHSLEEIPHLVENLREQNKKWFKLYEVDPLSEETVRATKLAAAIGNHLQVARNVLSHDQSHMSLRGIAKSLLRHINMHDSNR